MTERFRYEWLRFSGTAERVAAAARFPRDSDWFSGHFPGNPIVPGVALIALAKEAVMAWERGEGRSATIPGIRRVRFRQPVKPDDEVELEAKRIFGREGPAYAFKISLRGEAVCSGILRADIIAGRSE